MRDELEHVVGQALSDKRDKIEKTKLKDIKTVDDLITMLKEHKQIDEKLNNDDYWKLRFEDEN